MPLSQPVALLLVVSLGVLLPEPALADPPRDRAADAVDLRDGSVIFGEIVDQPNERGTLIRVRREWARQNVPDWAKRWEASERLSTTRAISQRRARLETWRRDRELSTAPRVGGDLISPWIGQELRRLSGVTASSDFELLVARISANDVRKVVRHPRTADGFLRQAWVAQLPNPEAMTADALKDALEGRGFDMSRPPPVSLEGMLPIAVESEPVWLSRRAATEVLNDPGLRLMSYQGILINDPGTEGQPRGMPPLQTLSAIGGMLAGQPDPLPARLQVIARWGKVGATVLKLEIAPDNSATTVDITLWVRVGPEHWQPAGTRRATVRVQDLGPDEGKDLGNDPQVEAVFKLVEAIGLREVGPEIRGRVLRVGAATQRALTLARSQAQADLTALAFPVSEHAPDRPEAANRR